MPYSGGSGFSEIKFRRSSRRFPGLEVEINNSIYNAM
jgi:hypothetical protein